MADIVTTPEVLGGKPRIAGTRVSVLDVVELVDAGWTTAEVARELEISKPDVQAARQYREEHSQEIEELVAKRRAAHRRLQNESLAPSS